MPRVGQRMTCSRKQCPRLPSIFNYKGSYPARRELCVPEERDSIIEKAITSLKRHQRIAYFNALAFRGVSGALIAPIIANEMKLGMIVVRQERVECHTPEPWEGVYGKHVQYVFVDDHVATGRTLCEIIQLIGPKASFRGAYFWQLNEVYGSWSNHPNPTRDGA